MDVSGDELAGVVDLFGALTPEELGDALVELAFKAGESVEPEDFAADIEEACRTYHLLRVGAEAHDLAVEAPLVLVGPVAFPTLPPGATDLPHILDIDERRVDRDTAALAAERAFRRDAARAVEAGATDRIHALVDVSYELEAWGPVDLASARAGLDDALE